ncbi:MAG: metal-sensing transcriptional repressor [Lachnospiraceae bacterium]|nr:metal-sensing transcriptional repressor [Lachnospiraceae bacterium]
MEKKKSNAVHTHILEDGTVVTHTHDTHHEHSHETSCAHEHNTEMEAHEHAHSHDHGHTHTHTHENTKAVLNRLSRAIGHLESIRRMVEDGRDCSEVLIQLSAVKSAINNTGKVILQDHIQHCLVDAIESGDMETIEELNKAIDRFIK